MFRDARTKVLKEDSFLVDCHTEASRHKIGKKIYEQNPNLKQIKNINLTSFQKKPDEDHLTPKHFKTLTNIFGSDLDNLVKSIMLSSKRKTLSERWSGSLIESGISHVTDSDSGDNMMIRAFSDVIDFMTQSWNTFLENVLLWTCIAIVGIFAVLWLIGFLKNLCCYGPRDNRTMQVAMAPFRMLWDCFLYLLEKFEIKQRNRQDVQNNVMVNNFWNANAIPLNQR